MFKESGFYRILTTLFARINADWQTSRLKRAVEAFEKKAGASVSGNLARKTKNGVWGFLHGGERHFEAGFLASLWSFAVNLLPMLFEKLWKVKPLASSYTFSLIELLYKNIHLLTGAFFAVMLACPHQYWNNIYALIGAAALSLICLMGMAKKGRRIDTGRSGFWYFAFIALMAASVVFSTFAKLSLRFIALNITGWLTVLLLLEGIDSEKQLKSMLEVMICGLLIAGTVGVVQGIIGVEVDPLLVDLSIEENADLPGRVYSVYANSNNFAEILVALIPLTAVMIFEEKDAKKRCIPAAALLVSLISLAMTFSRSGWIGFAVSVLVFAGLKNKRFIPLIIAFGLIAIPFMPTHIYNRILSIFNTKDSSTMTRFGIIAVMWQLICDYPLTGAGLGSDVTKTLAAGYKSTLGNFKVLHSHNVFLQVWAEMGIFALIAFVCNILYNMSACVKSCRKKASENLAYASVAGFCGILVIGLAEYIWYYPRVMFVFWLVFAVMLCAAKLGKGAEN